MLDRPLTPTSVGVDGVLGFGLWAGSPHEVAGFGSGSGRVATGGIRALVRA